MKRLQEGSGRSSVDLGADLGLRKGLPALCWQQHAFAKLGSSREDVEKTVGAHPGSSFEYCCGNRSPAQQHLVEEKYFLFVEPSGGLLAVHGLEPEAGCAAMQHANWADTMRGPEYVDSYRSLDLNMRVPRGSPPVYATHI